MPEDVEVDTDKLREQISEAGEGPTGASWLRYVGLAAAIFAAFAAVAALRASDLINEAMMNQLRASDTWAEYQSSRQKEHTYTIAADDLSDRPSKNETLIRNYHAQVAKEVTKEKALQAEARRLQDESVMGVRRHQFFEHAVALLQVGIALSAVAALARSKLAWYISVIVGAAGIIAFAAGFV